GSFLYYSLRSSDTVSNINDKLINEIKAYLKKNITEKITISKIAQEFNKSNSTIFSLFKQKTGYSIIHYFNLLKIQYACELINLTPMSLKEVSYELNFQDPLYFSRLFKKYMGVSPREYRKNL
uniref:helix-turn-helix domain-containing protein n=1 Tax=Aquiflexum sp. TaxID=1872584 RepID=UPI0035943D83